MVRVVIFFMALAAAAAGFAWFADRPGDVVLTWMGYRIETSLMVAALGIVLLIIVSVILWSILRGLWRSPEQVSLFFRHRRAMKGYLAISRGLIAIGSGDTKLAQRLSDDAARLSPGDPLTLLLAAQSAQLAGDRPAAERAFREMTRREETKLLGLRGLYIEAQRRGDAPAARRVAEEAATAAPALTWAGQAVLDDRCAASDWSGALAALENMRSGLAKNDYRRKRAVLLTARALALADRDRDASRAAVLEAVKLAPDLTPAAALAGRRLAEAGDQRKARRILEAAWTAHPHPDLADAYADLRIGDSGRERLARIQKLAGKVPGEREGALAVARVALEVREFATAREALAPYLSAPTQRVATLMAEVEEAEHGDVGRVREWMGRAMRAAGDPVWTADGTVSDRWLPVTPNGRLDGFEWRVPLAELGITRPVIEAGDTPPVPSPVVVAEPAPVVESVAPAPVAVELSVPAKSDPPVATPKPRARAARKPTPEPVMPLVNAPDDPGPDATRGDLGLDADPVPGQAPLPGTEPWQRMKGKFR